MNAKPIKEILEALQRKNFFWIWDHEKAVARRMTCWDTQPSFIEGFIHELKTALSLYENTEMGVNSKLIYSFHSKDA